MGNFLVPGGVSDFEAWILSVLAKSRRNFFEFGTCTGKTAYLFAANSPVDGHIETITLAPNQVGSYKPDDVDNLIAHQHAIEESRFTEFLYSGTPEAKKISQIFGDSKDFDETNHLSKYDLIFIDGSHAYSYIKSDTNKAMRMIKPGGIILWHDFIWRGLIDPTEDVAKFLSELAREVSLFHLRDTSLAVFRNPLSSNQEPYSAQVGVGAECRA